MNATRLGIAVVIFCYLVTDSPLARADDTVSLHEALKQDQVRLRITGLGASTGDSIQLTVERQSKEALRITLTPGTVFKSKSGKVQNMAGFAIKGERVTEKSYRPCREIVLLDDNPHTFIIEAYCMDFQKGNPGSDDEMELSAPDTRAAEILSSGQKSGASTKVIQAALWIERDQVSDSALKQRLPVNDDDIKASRVLLHNLQTASAKQSPRTVDKTQPINVQLDVKLAGEFNSYLRIALPRSVQPDCRLVLVYVAPTATTEPEKVILTPDGKVDDAIKDALATRVKSGITGDIHHVGTTFNNGAFDLVSTTNSHDKVGFYAVARVPQKQSDSRLGTSSTYFRISTWGTDKDGVVEIPLPESPAGAREHYISKNCDLFIWLITKDGTKIAQGKVRRGQ